MDGGPTDATPTTFSVTHRHNVTTSWCCSCMNERDSDCVFRYIVCVRVPNREDKQGACLCLYWLFTIWCLILLLVCWINNLQIEGVDLVCNMNVFEISLNFDVNFLYRLQGCICLQFNRKPWSVVAAFRHVKSVLLYRGVFSYGMGVIVTE